MTTCIIICTCTVFLFFVCKFSNLNQLCGFYFSVIIIFETKENNNQTGLAAARGVFYMLTSNLVVKIQCKRTRLLSAHNPDKSSSIHHHKILNQKQLTKVLSSMTYPYCAMLAPLLSEYLWVLVLVFDWIIRIRNSLIASTKICQKWHLFPWLNDYSTNQSACYITKS